MGFIDVSAAIEHTDELLTEKEKIQTEIASMRSLLRGAVLTGDATGEDKDWIESTFPEQQTKTPEQRVAEQEKKLQEAREKAVKAAQKAKQNAKGTA